MTATLSVDILALPLREVVATDGAVLAVHVAGDPDDLARPLVVLQHGFPDTPATFRHLLPVLVEEGYRVALPWLRGHPPSSPGRARGPVAVATDAATVHAALRGDGRAVFVGHDWGAMATWRTTVEHPGRWRAGIALGYPPESGFVAVLGAPSQLLRSAYLVGLQLPIDPALRAGDLAALRALWRLWSPSYRPTREDLGPLRTSLGTPAGMAGALDQYRGGLRDVAAGRHLRRSHRLPDVPVLYLHGEEDGCVSSEAARRTAARLVHVQPSSRVEVLAGVGHFLHLEAPAGTAELVTRFLRSLDEDTAAGR